MTDTQQLGPKDEAPQDRTPQAITLSVRHPTLISQSFPLNPK